MSFLASYRTRGFGSVYKARYIHSGEIVAVKKIRVEENPSDLLKEINILKECHCDFIIRYYESLVKDNHLWVLTYMGLYYMQIVMEYASCGSIADIREKRPELFSENVIRYILASMLLGILYLHQNKVIHRVCLSLIKYFILQDIKALNVLLTRDGKVKLTDFGISAKLDNTLSMRSTQAGTIYWMAPEILMGKKYDRKVLFNYSH